MTTAQGEREERTAAQIEDIARWLMASKGMPSLVINAPEDSDDFWHVYPDGHPAIGRGRTLAEAVQIAHDTMLLHRSAHDA